MKAVIVEIKDSNATVLMEDGTFRTMQASGEIGDVLHVPDAEILPAEDPGQMDRGTLRRIRTRKTIYAAVAAAAVMAAAFSGKYYYDNVEPVAYVTVDAASSVRFSLNRNDQVVEMTALSDEAAAIIEELRAENLSKEKIGTVLDRMIELMEEDGEMQLDEEDVKVESTRDEARQERLLGEMREQIEEKKAARAAEEAARAEKAKNADGEEASGDAEKGTGDSGVVPKESERADTAEGKEKAEPGAAEEAGRAKEADEAQAAGDMNGAGRERDISGGEEDGGAIPKEERKAETAEDPGTDTGSPSNNPAEKSAPAEDPQNGTPDGQEGTSATDGVPGPAEHTGEDAGFTGGSPDDGGGQMRESFTPGDRSGEGGGENRGPAMGGSGNGR